MTQLHWGGGDLYLAASGFLCIQNKVKGFGVFVMIDVVNNTLLLMWSKPKFVHQCQVDRKCRFAHPTSLWR